MSYCSYALVRRVHKNLEVLLACHPETMSAGLKAFRSPQDMQADLALLTKHFVPPVGALWICVSGDGNVFPKKIMDSSVLDDREDAPLRRLRRSKNALPELPLEIWLAIISKLPLQRRVVACMSNPELYLECKKHNLIQLKLSHFSNITQSQAKAVYDTCDRKMPHLHLLAEWMTYLYRHGIWDGSNHYHSWRSITSPEELAALGIKWKMPR